LINNRQGGRRRGRGGQRGQNLGGQPGNRQDNRQRGNAAQLLEKYKSMARDAQLAGDRVQTEYYLQFADHYFRVLSESRARFEDQRRQREDELDDEGGDEEFGDASEAESAGEERHDHQDRSERQDRPDRQDRGPRGPRRDRDHRRFSRDERAADASYEQDDTSERFNGREDSLPLDVLPPAIGANEPEAESPEESPAPRPRRRTRGPRPAEGEDEIAPAA
jgi:Domain of unknown function (DUF4167)